MSETEGLLPADIASATGRKRRRCWYLVIEAK